MRLAYDVATVRAAERVTMPQLPEGTLMARAAAGVAAVAADLLRGQSGHVYGARVLVLAGTGDNGGDALFAGAALAARGAVVSAVPLGARAHAGGLAALRRAGGRVLPGPGEPAGLAEAVRLAAAADLVLDGIVGIGGRGALREPAASVVRAAETGPGLLVAVDVPSGVEADTGEVPGAAVHADVTVTFGALKTGLLIDPGAEHAGVVQLVDIGLGPGLAQLGARADVEALEMGDVAVRLPWPAAETDKYRRGVVGVLAGSATYPGAAVLCAGAAARSGAGMVRYRGPGRPARAVLARFPEVVVAPGRVQAWAVGSGLDDPGPAREVLAGPEPAVVDAGALSELRSGRDAPTLLTPHAGELARLVDADRADIEARRLAHARAAARALGAVVALKGSTTLIAAPDGRVRVNPTGTPWLATAGSGDVLAGLAGGLLAGGLDPFEAGSVAAWVHGLAARTARAAGGDGPIVATDVLDALPAALGAALTSTGGARR